MGKEVYGKPIGRKPLGWKRKRDSKEIEADTGELRDSTKLNENRMVKAREF